MMFLFWLSSALRAANCCMKPLCYNRLATDPEGGAHDSHLAYLRDNFQRQKTLGLTTARLLPADEIRAMLPQLRSDDVLGGSFCSTDGFVDPYSVMNGFMTSATEHGATLWKKTEVTGIAKDQQGAFRVDTSRGQVSTRMMVNAAGAWAAQSAKLLDVDL